jgi:hypothetical protein
MEPVCREALIGEAAPGENHRQNPAERLPVEEECVIRLHASMIQYRTAIILKKKKKFYFIKEKNCKC